MCGEGTALNATKIDDKHGGIHFCNLYLPITLTSFSATCTEGIELNWETATEQNVAYFNILKSREGKEWHLVSSITAQGNSSTANSYSVIDYNGSSSDYYKLVAIDFDGYTEYFDPISVSCNKNETSWKAYPVPVKGQLNISTKSIYEFIDLLIIQDMMGRVVYQTLVQVKEGHHLIYIPTENLSQGKYFASFKNNSEFPPLKIIK